MLRSITETDSMGMEVDTTSRGYGGLSRGMGNKGKTGHNKMGHSKMGHSNTEDSVSRGIRVHMAFLLRGRIF